MASPTTDDPNKLRLTEVIVVTANPVDETGAPALLENESWNATSVGVIDVTQDPVLPRVATIAPLASGTSGFRFEGVDAFFDPVEVITPVTVLDAALFELRIKGFVDCELT
jgi:hypothetical protein